MFAGFVRLGGSTMTVPVVVSNTTGEPAVADSMPTYRIYDAGVSPGLLVADDELTTAGSTADGFYYIQRPIEASDGFAAGKQYVVIVDYTISGSPRRLPLTFSVV